MARVQAVANPRRRRRTNRRRRTRNPGSFAVTNPRRRRRRARRHRNPFGGTRAGGAFSLVGDAALIVTGLVGSRMLAERVVPDSWGTYGRLGARLALAVFADRLGARVMGPRVSRQIAIGAAVGALNDALDTLGILGAPALPAAAPAAVSGYVDSDPERDSLMGQSSFGGVNGPMLGVLAPRF